MFTVAFSPFSHFQLSEDFLPIYLFDLYWTTLPDLKVVAVGLVLDCFLMIKMKSISQEETIKWENGVS